eukprot:GFYU01014172.1.p1 GENE.GFYU01014172.1~~GFYU01014172.1.p1  ORF type:complete len:313 (+),score=68.60 GFYU01014172.1:58-939(+)
MPTPTLRFLNANFCPFGQRAWLALVEKNIPHEYVNVNYANTTHPTSIELGEINPDKTVPAARWNGKPVYDSLPLLNFLDEEYPEHPLLPKNTYQRFIARRLLKKHNDNCVSPLYQFLMAPKATKAELLDKRDKCIKMLKILNDDVKEYSGGGPYMLGEQFTMVDIAVAPFVERLEVLLAEYRNWRIPQTPEFEHFNRWYTNVKNRDSWKVTTAAPTKEVLEVIPMPEGMEKTRENLLIYFYQCYAANNVPESKKQMTGGHLLDMSSFDLGLKLDDDEQLPKGTVCNKTDIGLK